MLRVGRWGGGVVPLACWTIGDGGLVPGGTSAGGFLNAGALLLIISFAGVEGGGGEEKAGEDGECERGERGDIGMERG